MAKDIKVVRRYRPDPNAQNRALMILLEAPTEQKATPDSHSLQAEKSRAVHSHRGRRDDV